MSEWTHTLTVIVPESLMDQANQLALAMGTSEDDVNTFRTADWTTGTANFAIAHTQAVEQIMDYFALIPVELQCGVVFPTMCVSAEGVTTLIGSDMTKIQVFVDQEPFHVLSILGLARHEHYLG